MKNKTVEIKNLKIREVIIPIKGVSPLIVHRFDEKARRQIEDKQQKKSKSSKHEIRMPEEDYEAAKHKSPQGWDGFPARGFKKCMVRGAQLIGMVMKAAQMDFFVFPDCEDSQLVRIEGDSEMRTDSVRIGMGTDIRYRPEYKNWSAKLRISFNEGRISVDEIYQILYAAGYGVGIGEMRPEKTGFTFGRFELDQ